ncbi:response regulator [Myxococcota bacterium]|nr:response regulator [Myxococcota bacterium]
MDRPSDPRSAGRDVDYQVPQVARCRTTDGVNVIARILQVATDGVFLDAVHGELPYGDRVRVTFVTAAEPPVVLEGHVVSIVRGRGVRVEAVPETSPDVLEILSDWAEGRPATVCFPARDPSSSQERLGPPPLPLLAHAHDRLRGRKILVIDDDPLVLRTIERLLGALGADVVGTKSAPEAIALVGQSPPDVVLLDWLMPSYPGDRVLAELHRTNDKLPVAVISGGLWWQDAEQQIQSLGASAVLRKPLDLDEVASWIEHVATPHTGLAGHA